MALRIGRRALLARGLSAPPPRRSPLQFDRLPPCPGLRAWIVAQNGEPVPEPVFRGSAIERGVLTGLDQRIAPILGWSEKKHGLGWWIAEARGQTPPL